MIDKNKIPEPTYVELVELFGIDKAEKIIIDNQYNFRTISNIILGERIVRFLGVNKVRNTILRKIHLSANQLLIIVIIIFSIVYIFWPW